MKTGAKIALGSGLLFVIAVGGEALYLHHRNALDNTVTVAKSDYQADPDDLVFLRSEHPISLKDEKDLKGRTIWVSAGGQLDYYPLNGRTVDFDHSQGVLLGAEPIVIKDAVEQAAPKKAAFRIPQGDKQVLLVFTKPGNPRLFAVAVGDLEAGNYNLLTDQIFFYDDPHKLYAHWSPDTWKAIDEHRAILGMNERQVQLALGQISTNHGDKIGDRSVEYDNQDHPKMVTFEAGKATRIIDEKQ